MWNFEGEVETSLARSNLFIIQFSSSDARDRVLEQGPWHIRNEPLIVIKWELGIPLYMDHITTSYQRLTYAKVCVKIAVSAEIPSSIEVQMKDRSPISISVKVPWHP
ncbi:hypothetical protein DITRI_Ditri08aG0066800 [Diplodiscus trichospermus]